MERHAGAEYRAQHDGVGYVAAGARRQRGGHLHVLVVQRLAYLICHDLARAMQVAAKSHRIGLHCCRAHLHHILGEKRIMEG